jgi:hypothetical protein
MSNLVSNIANVSLALSFVVALIFGIAQVRVAARDRRERLALESLRNFQSREFAELIHSITSHDMPSTREKLRALSHEEQITFIQLSQQMEMLGLLVAYKLVGIELIDRTLGSFVTLAWEKYKPVFMSMRKNDPYIGEYFQWLAERIEEEMKNNPREPFYKTASKK